MSPPSGCFASYTASATAVWKAKDMVSRVWCIVRLGRLPISDLSAVPLERHDFRGLDVLLCANAKLYLRTNLLAMILCKLLEKIVPDLASCFVIELVVA